MEADLRDRGYLDPRGVLKAVQEVTEYYDSLKPSLGHFLTATDRTELFALSGTVPLPARGKVVKVIIWMPKKFPREPPLIYIQKPKDCFINPASHLDLSGLVRHDYLRQWNHGRPSLADFIQILIADFTENLPIFSLDKFNLPKRVRENISDLLKQVPSFRLDLRMHDKEEMLLVKGSVTLRAADMSHTRRVDMWLPESFPTEPPWVYVHPSDGSTPTPGTAAYNQCNIDMPYLRDWNYQKSCLQVLMEVVKIECTDGSSACADRASDQRTQRNKRPPWMLPPREHTPGEQCTPTTVRDGPLPSPVSTTQTRRQPRPSPRPRRASEVDNTSNEPEEHSTSELSSMRSNSDKSKQGTRGSPSTDTVQNARAARHSRSGDLNTVKASESPPGASGEMLQFAAKAGLSDDTVRRLASHGFKNLRPVLALNENDLEALNLPEMAQKILLREGIRSLQHMEVECYGRSGASSVATGTSSKDISETMSEMFSRVFRNILDDYLVEEQLICLGEKLGKGEYGIVYKGTYDNPHSRVREDVAIKTLSISSAAESSVDSFVHEIIKMRPLKHRHIMELKGVTFKLGKPCCIMPYMENGDLRSYVRNPQKTFYLRDLLTLALELAEGMKYLAEHHFIHGDLAARNCLVDSCGTIKVSDFGLSRQLFQSDYFKFDLEKGQPVRWMAIEALTQLKYTRESDRWSFGVVLWELMMRGETPYAGISNREVVFKVKNGYRLPRPDNLEHAHQSVYDLMLACWQDDGLRRPTFGEICIIITGWTTEVPVANRARPRSRSDRRPDWNPMVEVPAREVSTLPGNTTLDTCNTRLNSGYLKPIQIGLGNTGVGQTNRTGPASCTHPSRTSPNSQGTTNSTGTEHTAGARGGPANHLGTCPGVSNRRPPPPPPPPPRKGSQSSTPPQHH